MTVNTTIISGPKSTTPRDVTGESVGRERQKMFSQHGVALSYWHSEYFYPAPEILEWAEQVRAYRGEPMLTGPLPPH